MSRPVLLNGLMRNASHPASRRVEDLKVARRPPPQDDEVLVAQVDDCHRVAGNFQGLDIARLVRIGDETVPPRQATELRE